MKVWGFFKVIGWRLLASYFFMLLLFFSILKLHAVDNIYIMGALGVSFLLAVAFAWVLYHRFIGPLREITETSRDIARGNLERKISATSMDEIGDLARSINDMATRLRQTISEITEQKNRAQAVLDSMADVVLALDGKGRIIMVNPAVETIFGISQAECVGKSVVEVIRNFDLDMVLQKVQGSHNPVAREIKIISPEPRIFMLRVTPLAGSGQGGVVVLLRDITERKRMEQMRSEFMANASHELRTPLTSIRGFVETLMDSGTEDPQMTRHFLEIIAAETARLSNLLDDLLDLSRIEERRVVHRWQREEIGTLVDRVLTICGTKAEEKQIAIKANLPPRLPYLFGDPDLLAQVFINLVDNAIKYTPEGGTVTLSASVTGDEIKIEVADTGAGIPAENLPRIFERFYRVEKARTRDTGGTGLGLAIVKHIVKGHGGRVEVKSVVGKGTVFSVFLPLEMHQAPQVPDLGDFFP
ncbi:MAG: ATP-binding protein [Firmicutes bacterium]|nr:ATP-binding protein [Bacillota bacterium]